jgi:hypothetical protein
MHFAVSRRTIVGVGALTLAVSGLTAATGSHTSRTVPLPMMGLTQQVGQPGDESSALTSAMDQFYGARLWPGNVAPGAYTAAYQHVQGMPTAPQNWSEVTNQPYNGDDPEYRDLVASNSSAGVGHVTGRITGLAVDGSWIYAGGAQGGVFRSHDGGQTWTAISDQLPALATGDLQVNPADHSLWLGTGEHDFGDELGSGIYRLANPHTGHFTPADRVGGDELESHSVAKIAFDQAAGYVFAATSRGVYRHSLTNLSGSWDRVMFAVANDDPNLFAFSNMTNDIAVRPGSNGQTVVANLAWRAGAPQNGFYVSRDAGTTWHKTNVTGAINPKDIGVADLAYSSDGSKLYVVLESPTLYNKFNSATTLGGIYVAPKGNPAGPYNRIATAKSLSTSGSAEKQTVIGKGYLPGVQAWYNRFVAVDPNNPDHVYVGLEEVYETTDGGATWNTIGRYWNFGFKCWSYIDSHNTCNGNVVHPDQHSVAIGNGRVYVGNDGGLYTRPLTNAGAHWDDLSASGGLRTLQYYSVAVGQDPDTNGLDVWGGLQDNGVSLKRPGLSQMVSPIGGDGGDELVNPNNGCQAVGEYVYLHLQMTNNCGQTDGSTRAITIIDPNDPNPQFIAPISPDTADPNGYWVAGGEYIYGNTDTWDSQDGSSWNVIGDTGDFANGVYHSATAVAAQSHVVWAGWCGPCSSSTWQSGIVTNYDPTQPGNVGDLHQASLNLANGGTLPNRYVAGLTIDPSDPTGATAYAVYNGFSAHWVEGFPAAGFGHVFKTTNGGQTWHNVSGATSASDSLPDVPSSHLAITSDGTLVLTTDVGVFLSQGGGHWAYASGGLPYTISTDVEIGPDGNTYVATYGRGIWKMPTP